MSSEENSQLDAPVQEPQRSNPAAEAELAEIEEKLSAFVAREAPTSARLRPSNEEEKKKVYKEAYKTLADIYLAKEQQKILLRFMVAKSKRKVSLSEIQLGTHMTKWVRGCWMLRLSDSERKKLEDESIADIDLKGEETFKYFQDWWKMKLEFYDKRAGEEKEKKSDKRGPDESSINESELPSMKKRNIADHPEETGSDNPSSVTPATTKSSVNHHRIWE